MEIEITQVLERIYARTALWSVAAGGNGRVPALLHPGHEAALRMCVADAAAVLATLLPVGALVYTAGDAARLHFGGDAAVRLGQPLLTALLAEVLLQIVTKACGSDIKLPKALSVMLADALASWVPATIAPSR